ncbi:hypothetical protein llap_1977 [Limosa lapponica baueri]|uniref:Uncharacterized protein n=1 Tax=Limosa lapponica baueri TaxID=1758121 RepID=A0A2I0UNT7_LIMLA|nr:hypothetical protein llap_1977 [Limosa lapponica baueri]
MSFLVAHPYSKLYSKKSTSQQKPHDLCLLSPVPSEQLVLTNSSFCSPVDMSAKQAAQPEPYGRNSTEESQLIEIVVLQLRNWMRKMKRLKERTTLPEVHANFSADINNLLMPVLIDSSISTIQQKKREVKLGSL